MTKNEFAAFPGPAARTGEGLFTVCPGNPVSVYSLTERRKE